MNNFNSNKNFGARQCPKCHYKYDKTQYFKKIYFRPIWKSWNCDNCGTSIRIDPKRRVINVLILGIILLGLFQMKDIIENKFIYISISILIILIVTSILALFDKFKLANRS